MMPWTPTLLTELLPYQPIIGFKNGNYNKNIPFMGDHSRLRTESSHSVLNSYRPRNEVIQPSKPLINNTSFRSQSHGYDLPSYNNNNNKQDTNFIKKI